MYCVFGGCFVRFNGDLVDSSNVFGCSWLNLIVFGVLVKWLFTCFSRDGEGERVRAGISKIVGLG